MKRIIKLGVNIDHAATLRNTRRENNPSLITIAQTVLDAGADLVTMHLREDRRHIKEEDLFLIKNHVRIPINMEMGMTDEMANIALRLEPYSVCLVPENREELTTEGGLNLSIIEKKVKLFYQECSQKGIKVFAFVDPEFDSINRCIDLNLDGVEIHTGAYVRKYFSSVAFNAEWNKICKVAELCDENSLEFHAGHGLDLQYLRPLIHILNLVEVNIGHAIIVRALFSGLPRVIQKFKETLNDHWVGY